MKRYEELPIVDRALVNLKIHEFLATNILYTPKGSSSILLVKYQNFLEHILIKDPSFADKLILFLSICENFELYPNLLEYFNNNYGYVHIPSHKMNEEGIKEYQRQFSIFFSAMGLTYLKTGKLFTAEFSSKDKENAFFEMLLLNKIYYQKGYLNLAPNALIHSISYRDFILYAIKKIGQEKALSDKLQIEVNYHISQNNISSKPSMIILDLFQSEFGILFPPDKIGKDVNPLYVSNFETMFSSPTVFLSMEYMIDNNKLDGYHQKSVNSSPVRNNDQSTSSTKTTGRRSHPILIIACVITGLASLGGFLNGEILFVPVIICIITGYFAFIY